MSSVQMCRERCRCSAHKNALLTAADYCNAGLLGGKKAKRKLPRKLTSASSSSRGTSDAMGVKPGQGKAKGRRITMGDDSIRIP